MKKLCKCGCGCDISNKHANAKFKNNKHKDKYWNMINPRGKFRHLNSRAHDIINYMCDDHPFSSEALGQE